ncbi:hypothetical protein RMN57_22505 [Kitasatospora sp. CM 4170]|uniref:Uncharacterized protein n=1 Tax=Kitasatospora aburaviensis TaxID=67265 RepID=A0ABW1F3H5_9ACTN|nr:hypothetical protein [Kitasatospora sp. CM 4170]WNM47273.1 hypothetical protein RMN57_22505 [Kitasatospora sp. CM 4170]
MSQRRSYPNSGDFNLDDLFRPEPGQPQGQPGQPQGQAVPGQQQPTGGPSVGQSYLPPAGPPSGRPEYLGEGAHAMPTQAMPAQAAPWGGAPQPGYPQAEPAPDTQYLPPYPTGDPAAGGYPAQPGYPQAAPAAPVPGFPQQSGQGHPAQQGQYGQPAAPEYPGRDFPTQAGSGRGGRSSNKLVIGGVVAGCVAAGVLVAVLMSGGDDAPGPEKKAGPAVTGSGTSTGSPAATGSAAPSVSPEVKAQAQALSDLLGTANDSRQAVIGAVGAVQKCDKLPESQQALTDAAGKRRELQTKLAALKTDKLPSGPQLVEQLNAAWQASATADDEYAAWAGDMQGGCDAKKTDNQHYKNAVQASGSATNAKKQASGLWNAIAGQTGLPNRGDGDL